MPLWLQAGARCQLFMMLMPLLMALCCAALQELRAILPAGCEVSSQRCPASQLVHRELQSDGIGGVGPMVYALRSSAVGRAAQRMLAGWAEALMSWQGPLMFCIVSWCDS